MRRGDKAMRTTKRCATDRAGPPESLRGFSWFRAVFYPFRAICLSPVPPGGTRRVGFGLGRRIKFGPNPAKNEALGGAGGATRRKMGHRHKKGGAGGSGRLDLL